MKTQKRHKPRVLFHRSWTQYNGGTSGGQLKVRDAYDHILHSKTFEPHIYFGPETVWLNNPGNVWNDLQEKGIPAFDPKEGDVIFFAGHDWKVLDPTARLAPPVPVVNIAQPRQIMLQDPRRDYLKHPAIRIVKSSIAKNILEEYGVNGPVYVIPDAIDRSLLPDPNPNPDLDILIVGLKNPGLAKSLQRKLRWYARRSFQKLKIEIQIPPKLPTRMDFINLLNRTKIALFLPLDAERGAEGFYLPALEGMALRKLVICPYAVGNIDFCIPGETCIQPAFTEKALYRSVIQALKMPEEARQTMIEKGYQITENHTIEKERASIIKLINEAYAIWNQKNLFHN